MFLSFIWKRFLYEGEAANMYALDVYNLHKNVKTYTATLVRIARPEDFVN